MNITIPNELYESLREKAFKEHTSMSGLIVKALGGTPIGPLEAPIGKIEVTTSEIKPKCERQFCHQFSEGRYKVITNDGTEEWTGELCTFHWHQARKEGECIALT